MPDNTKAAELADLLECHAGFARTETGKLLRQAAALLRASEGRVPEGWRLVPIEPTDHMLDVGKREAHRNNGAREKALRMFKAMAAAAPHPPAQQAEPLFLLHTGEIDSSGEQAEWEIEHDSQQRVDAFCALNPGVTVKLYAGPPPHKAEGAEHVDR